MEALRAKKAQMPEPEYYAQLEKLLLSLSHVYDENAGGRGGEGGERA